MLRRNLLVGHSVPCLQHFSERFISSVTTLCFQAIENGIQLNYRCCERILHAFSIRKKRPPQRHKLVAKDPQSNGLEIPRPVAQTIAKFPTRRERDL